MTSDRPISADALRSAYLSFFQERGHLLMPSASLVPAGDPTLLLTSAGMVPFKPYFTGDEQPPSRRLTSVQKCFRTTDIDVVGDHTHLTFFEMLGNFSIGDYFKKEAIAWAWEFVTGVLWLPPERLWVTVFLDDDEAYDYWTRGVGVPAERIIRFDEKDNFWGPAGNEGPCGPCSELHYDLYPERGISDERPNDESGRFVEIWNLVFMQFYEHQDGTRVPLPAPNIDTGMGFDRTVAILQDKASVYDTDLLAPIVQRVATLAGKTYGQDEQTAYAIRVVADHGRSAAFLIADGVVPSNDGRGYVLRRVVRRAIRHGRRLGVEGPFLAQVAETVIERMGSAYPELVEHRRFVLRALELEEERFAQALAMGIPLLEGVYIPVCKLVYIALKGPVFKTIEGERTELSHGDKLSVPVNVGLSALHDFERQLTEKGQYSREISEFVDRVRSSFRRGHVSSRIPGDVAFLLHDTYGFPLELTQEIAREHGLEVDEKGFEAEMEAQRERGRAGGKFGGGRDLRRTYEALGVDETPFLGYERLDADTVVVGLLPDGAPVERVTQGQEVEVVLQETPFYPEGGGQVGDAGVIHHARGKLLVRDTQRPVGNLIAHHATVAEGEIAVGDRVRAEVDAQRRADVMRNHTATHLLHQALRQVLGTHVRQAGSLVAPDYLRFDFTHVGPVTLEETDTIQRLVNDVIRQNLAAQKRETTYREAIAEGALAFFGDRYPDRVRVLEIGKFSYEVCGGTHVDRSGDIGSFRIVGESGIGSGLRRVEAVTGRGADAWVDERLHWLNEASKQLQATAADVPQRLAALMDGAEQARRLVVASQRDASLGQVEGLLAQVRQIDGVALVAAQVSAQGAESLREMGDGLRDKLGSGIVVLGGVFSDRPSVVVMVTPDLVAKGYKAGDIARAAARQMGGGGGGRPELAQAGGKEPGQLPAALEAAVESVREKSR